jgi:UDP-glucose 4-epimerase
MTRETWLITGGAGYIGAHIANAFMSAGNSVVLYDSLYRGIESRVNYLCTKYNINIPFIKADIRAYNEIENVIRTYKINGIIHAAALKSVSESIQNPEEYSQVNLIATSEILEIAKRNGVQKFIFSSTAAVYGDPNSLKASKEEDIKKPISPYGDSKYKAEFLVTDFFKIPGNQATSLRFFNVIGTAAPELMDNSQDNLIPIILHKIKNGMPIEIYGSDYPTPDGTCVRDYVDVRDIARAHLVASKATSQLPPVMNIGTGYGASVREIIKIVFEMNSEAYFEVMEANRRTGDPAFLCADNKLAKKSMGFETEYSLEASVRSLF